MAKRDERKEAIRALVRLERMRTQRDLVERLQERGFDCTQATVSRDIADLGLVKTESGVYALPQDLALHRLLTDMAVSVEDAGNIIVVKTRPGGASMVGEIIDNAEIAGLVGTIAGDNTIMVVTKTPEDALRITGHMRDMLR